MGRSASSGPSKSAVTNSSTRVPSSRRERRTAPWLAKNRALAGQQRCRRLPRPDLNQSRFAGFSDDVKFFACSVFALRAIQQPDTGSIIDRPCAFSRKFFFRHDAPLFSGDLRSNFDLVTGVGNVEWCSREALRPHQFSARHLREVIAVHVA